MGLVHERRWSLAGISDKAGGSPLADPRFRILLLLLTVASISFSLLLYLLDMYLATGAFSAREPRIPYFESDIILSADSESSPHRLTVSEEFQFTEGDGTSGFLRLLPDRAFGIDVDSPVGYQVNFFQLDGRNRPLPRLEQASGVYRLRVLPEDQLLPEGQQRVFLQYEAGSYPVFGQDGPKLIWTFLNPWPGRTDSVRARVTLPWYTSPEQVRATARIRKRGEEAPVEANIPVTVAADDSFSGQPRTIAQVQSPRTLRAWEYLELELSW